MASIEARDIYKIYGPHPQRWLARARSGMSRQDMLEQGGHALALRAVDLSVASGRIQVVMGLSGSGKSTLIRLLNRLIEPTAGSLHVNGEDILRLGAREMARFRRQSMSMVFQHFALFPHRTVLDNVAYGLEVLGVARRKREAAAHHWLEQVGLDDCGARLPRELSGGMQQRVGLARALATDAEILLMDEPFSALDPLIRREMQDLLLALQRRLCKTIVFITHDLDEGLRLGDRIAILREGERVLEAAPQDILARPEADFVQKFLRDVNRLRLFQASAAIDATDAGHAASGRSSPRLALYRMLKHGLDYLPVVEEGRLRGVLALPDVRRAVDRGETALSGCMQEVARLAAGAPLEEAVRQLMHGVSPLAVVDEGDGFLGWLSPRRVAVLLDAGMADDQR